MNGISSAWSLFVVVAAVGGGLAVCAGAGWLIALILWARWLGGFSWRDCGRFVRLQFRSLWWWQAIYIDMYTEALHTFLADQTIDQVDQAMPVFPYLVHHYQRESCGAARAVGLLEYNALYPADRARFTYLWP